MSVTIRIPTVLRTYTSNRSEIEVATGTLRAAIDSVEQDSKGFKSALINSKGEINPSAVIYVNEEDVRFGQKLDTQLNSGDEVLILPAASGGC